MTRAGRAFAATTVISVALAIWFYLDNRTLEHELAQARATQTKVAPAGAPAAPGPAADPWSGRERSQARRTGTGTGPAPALPEPRQESRLERRQRHQQEFAAMFGRLDGETEDEYRSRIVPLIQAGLAIPRARVDELRRQVEAKAGVSEKQSRQLDQAFEQVYADALDYTNKAIADGVLSPYERNVSGWLEYAGGLGGILGDANGQIGQILTPQQIQAITQSGFEWGEYLGANAPWEQLQPPPPPK